MYLKVADIFEHKGLTYCASCDGPLFSGQDVVVIGAGNAAFESASQLLAYCKSVTLINRTDQFRADPVTVDTVSKHPNFKIINNLYYDKYNKIVPDELKDLDYTVLTYSELKKYIITKNIYEFNYLVFATCSDCL